MWEIHKGGSELAWNNEIKSFLKTKSKRACITYSQQERIKTIISQRAQVFWKQIRKAHWERDPKGSYTKTQKWFRKTLPKKSHWILHYLIPEDVHLHHLPFSLSPSKGPIICMIPLMSWCPITESRERERERELHIIYSELGLGHAYLIKNSN